MPVTARCLRRTRASTTTQEPVDVRPHQVATGPYMIKTTARQAPLPAGQVDRVVRNPNWDADKDYSPAYLDSSTFAEGFDDPASPHDGSLDGKSQVSGDFTMPPTSSSRSRRARARTSSIISPGGGNRYVASTRRSSRSTTSTCAGRSSAALDRQAMLQVRGGAVVGDVANALPPAGRPRLRGGRRRQGRRA